MTTKTKTKIDWNKIETVKFSILKATEGGMGYGALGDLKYAGIPARKSYSCYVGQVGIEIPKKFEHKAEKLLWG